MLPSRIVTNSAIESETAELFCRGGPDRLENWSDICFSQLRRGGCVSKHPPRLAHETRDLVAPPWPTDPRGRSTPWFFQWCWHCWCKSLVFHKVFETGQVARGASPEKSWRVSGRLPAWSLPEAGLCHQNQYVAVFRPDASRESLKIGPPAGLRPAGGPIFRLSRLESGRNPARKTDFRPGSTTA